MADLKKLSDEIRALLRQLNGRQKATLIAFGGAIFVPLLLLTVRTNDESWLAVHEGVSFAPALLNQAEQTLRDSGVDRIRVDGQRLYVLSDRLRMAEAALTAAGIFSPNEESDHEAPSSLFDLFQSPGSAERESQQQLHKDIERALSAVAGIEKATVISSRSKPTRWNQKPDVAAAVYVTPAATGRLTSDLRASIFTSVARMIPDLDPQRIVVIDQRTGRSWTTESNTTIADLREEYLDRVSAALNWIPGVEVRVAIPSRSTSPESVSGQPVVKSIPNQPGAIDAFSTAEIEVLVPSLIPDVSDPHAEAGTVLSPLHGNGPEVKNRIVRAVKRALPAGLASVVSVTAKPDSILIPQSGVESDSAASPPVLWGLFSVAAAALVLLTRVRRRADQTTERPMPPKASPGETLSTESHAAEDSAAGANIPQQEASQQESLNTARQSVPAMTVERKQQRFDYLCQADPLDVYRLLAGEHPQTMALVLRHLPTKLATNVASLLPSGVQSDVIRRIAEADLSDSEVVDELEVSLRTTIATQPASEPSGGLAGSPEPGGFLGPLSRFEEIVELSPENLRRVTEEVEGKLWANALRGSSETLRFRIIASMPPQQARSVRAQLNADIPASDVAITRNRIIETVNALSLPDNSRPLRHEFVA